MPIVSDTALDAAADHIIRLRAINAELLAALMAVMADTEDLTPNFCADLSKDTLRMIRAAIAKAEAVT
jgi:hypothetical protein